MVSTPALNHTKIAAFVTDRGVNGLAVLKALNNAQREKGILSFSKTGDNNLAEAFKHNVVLEYAGVRTAGRAGGAASAT